jgi:hypothetical protein
MLDINHIHKVSKKNKILRPYDLWVGLFKQEGPKAPEFIKTLYSSFSKNIDLQFQVNAPGEYAFTVIYEESVLETDFLEISADFGKCFDPEICISGNNYDANLCIYFSDFDYTKGNLKFTLISSFFLINPDQFFTITIKKYY